MKYLVTGGSGFIGTNLIEALLRTGHEIINVDIASPKIDAHASHWRKVDILDLKGLLAVFNEFRPDHVVHLAARIDTVGTSLDEYVVNTKGTENVLSAIKAMDSIKRAVITSTQFVNQYSGVPKDDLDYSPHTFYGASKVINEQMTRRANLECTWTIIRPTNIWGPWHPRYPHEFWSVLGKGLYFHPNVKNIIRSYGYVKNVVHQIVRIFEVESNVVSSQVFYVGDEPIEQFEWVNGFSVGLTGKEVRVIPTSVLRMIALCGDVLATLRVKFPITSSRFRSMTTSNNIPMAKTIKAFGISPYTLEDGIKDTVDWLKMYYPGLVKAK